MNPHPKNIDGLCFYCQDGYVSVEGQCEREEDNYKDTTNSIKLLYPGCALIKESKCNTCRWSEGFFMTRSGLCTQSPNWKGNEDRELLGLGIEVNLFKKQSKPTKEAEQQQDL